MSTPENESTISNKQAIMVLFFIIFGVLAMLAYPGYLLLESSRTNSSMVKGKINGKGLLLNGFSFVAYGPDNKIEWIGSNDYTMKQLSIFVKVEGENLACRVSEDKYPKIGRSGPIQVNIERSSLSGRFIDCKVP